MSAVYTLISGEAYAVEIRPCAAVSVELLSNNLVQVEFNDAPHGLPLKIFMTVGTMTRFVDAAKDKCAPRAGGAGDALFTYPP